MKHYLSTNDKLKKNNIYSFGIPAYKSVTGLITCPSALNCIKGCYARQGRYAMPNVKTAQENRLMLTQSSEFVETISKELVKRKVKILRIHDSGDFYSLQYFTNWMLIVQRNPNVKFYAYTKQIVMLKGMVPLLPKNFTLIFSYGGKNDSLIDTAKDRHSKVFSSLKELRANKYQDTTKRDINALGANNKIGLVYHGFKSRTWSTELAS